MTETQASMLLYRDILIIMALILFIANQLVVLYRELYQDMIIRRVRKLASRRQPIAEPKREKVWAGKKNRPAVQRETKEFDMPHFSVGQWIGGIAGGIALLAVLVVAYGMLTYQP